jgi:aminoglycoside phosphotransferase (APT) family kinase protein
MYEGKSSLIHIDYRLDNMIFGGVRPLTVVDWQSLGLGCPVQDASYFLGTCLDSDSRRQEERQLLRLYLDVLKSYGVEMSEDECFSLYRNYAPSGFITAVFGTTLFEQTKRGNEMFMAMATRSCQMCIDLETTS